MCSPLVYVMRGRFLLVNVLSCITQAEVLYESQKGVMKFDTESLFEE